MDVPSGYIHTTQRCLTATLAPLRLQLLSALVYGVARLYRSNVLRAAIPPLLYCNVRGVGPRLKRSIHMSALAQAAAIERGVGLLPLQIRRHQEELFEFGGRARAVGELFDPH